MKRILVQNHDGYDVAVAISEPMIDPEATKNNIMKNHPDNFNFSKEMMLKYAVYFLSPSDVLVEDSVAENILEIMDEENMLATVSGQRVACFCGKKVWSKLNGKWENRTIDKLNEYKKEHEIFDDDLTAEHKAEIFNQNEEERIKNLNAEQKQIEKSYQEENALNEASNLKVKFEIQGDESSVALEKAKAFYSDELKKIGNRYK